MIKQVELGDEINQSSPQAERRDRLAETARPVGFDSRHSSLPFRLPLPPSLVSITISQPSSSVPFPTPPTYTMPSPPSFSAGQRDLHAAAWSASVSHRFVTSLWAGTLPPTVMARYLAQDYLFVDAFIALMGAAVSHADRARPRLLIARQLGLIANDEDGFFVRALQELQPSALDPTTPTTPLAPTAGFLDLMDDARASYAEALTVLLVAEWLYLDWASPSPSLPMPKDWVGAEWIELHRGEGFEKWVELLKDETDRVAEAADEETRRRMADVFGRAVELELAFFDAAFE